MKKKSFTMLLSLFMGLGIWSSCQVTHPYTAPKQHLDEQYRAPHDYTDTLTMAAVQWTALFTDPLLQELITEGLNANIDLRIAIERLNESQAQLRLQKSALYPSLSSSVSVQKSQLPSSQRFGGPKNNTPYDWVITTGWEVDIWGKLGSAKRAAVSQLLATAAAKRAVQTRVVADIATLYYHLLALDQQFIVTQKTAQNRAEDAAAIQLLFENAVVNGVAVVQSRANFYEAELDLPDIEQKIKETENRLCFLLARNPGPVQRLSLSEQQLVYNLSPGIPAQLLAHRPDLQVAELNFRTAFEETNVARTYFYPALTVTASGGFSNLGWSQWFSSQSLFGSIAGGLTQSIFNKGVNKARLTTAESRQKQALFQFEQSLLLASQEVSNALFEYETASKKEHSRKKQLEALTQAVAFNKELFIHHQNINYTDVLTAEQNLLRAEMRNIQDQNQKLNAVVQLYRALGGGWLN